MKRLALLFLGLAACGGSDEGLPLLAGSGGGGGTAAAGGAGTFSAGVGGAGGGGFENTKPKVPMYSELWYSVDQLLVRIVLELDGKVAGFQTSAIVGAMELGQNAITMLDDGSLLGARLSQTDNQTYLYHIADPPRDGSDVTPVSLGVMPDGIMLEALYTDCEGRVYGMDTGADDVSATGNRLLRFTGDVTAGDFDYVVVSDLATASVADIDDMGPGIDGQGVTDNPGLAIDTGTIHAFDYQTGSGQSVAQAGTYGIHALGGPLFGDGISRLFVLSVDAELFEIDPVTFAPSAVLAQGPVPAQGKPGWSGLAGPLTDCVTGFVPK